MSDVEAFFDESESGGFFCLAGYIFTHENSVALSREWISLLESYKLPYFHMKEATNPKGFRHLSPADTRLLSIALHDLIKKYSSRGYAATFDLKHEHLLPSARMHGLWKVSPYVLCSYFCLMSVRHWVNDSGYSGLVDYHFEQGHRSQGEANQVMSDIFAVPELRDAYRYGSHSFSGKEDVLLLQTADIFAWHWRKNVVERSKGNMKVRADLNSLLEQADKYFIHHFDADTLIAFLDSVVRGQNPNVITFKIKYKVDL
jgi:hypothetical protein